MEKAWKNNNTLTPQQENFFKNSKCRDEEGTLLVCYHGSSNEFETFSKKKIGSTTDYGLFGPGFYFTDSEEKAIGWGEDKKEGEYYIYKVYLNIERPYVIDSQESEDKYFEDYCRGMEEAAKKDGFDPEKDNLAECNGLNLIKCRQENLDRFLSKYDGVIQTYVNDDYSGNDPDFYQYVVYEPNQIKKIDNLNPTESNNMNESKSWNNSNVLPKLNEATDPDIKLFKKLFREFINKIRIPRYINFVNPYDRKTITNADSILNRYTDGDDKIEVLLLKEEFESYLNDNLSGVEFGSQINGLNSYTWEVFLKNDQGWLKRLGEFYMIRGVTHKLIFIGIRDPNKKELINKVLLPHYEADKIERDINRGLLKGHIGY